MVRVTQLLSEGVKKLKIGGFLLDTLVNSVPKSSLKSVIKDMPFESKRKFLKAVLTEDVLKEHLNEVEVEYNLKGVTIKGKVDIKDLKIETDWDEIVEDDAGFLSGILKGLSRSTLNNFTEYLPKSTRKDFLDAILTEDVIKEYVDDVTTRWDIDGINILGKINPSNISVGND